MINSKPKNGINDGYLVNTENGKTEKTLSLMDT